MRFIGAEDLRRLAEELGKSAYGQYLLRVLSERLYE
jgi:dTDP-glucose pyrophosphorylase